MNNTIQREIFFSQSRERVWRAIADRAALAQWIYPNDFEPRVGHRFTFQVPANPKVGFDGMAVCCEVLVCEPPVRLVFSWSAGALLDSRVSFQLEAHGTGTRLLFEHAGFDTSQPPGNQAFRGAGYGWTKMFEQLAVLLAGPDTNQA